jgi:hypothetical protein
LRDHDRAGCRAGFVGAGRWPTQRQAHDGDARRQCCAPNASQ